MLPLGKPLIGFVINIGNQVKTGEGSLLYGLLHLHTPVMVVAGRWCGAIKAADVL